MIAITSILSYRQLKLTGLDLKESEYILNFLRRGKIPHNSREIAIKTGIERTNVTRTLYDLIESNKIKVEKLAKCSITKRTVKYYTIND